MGGWLIFLALLGVGAVMLLAQMIRIVRQSEQAIVERLGRFSRTLDSGINFLIPVFDRVVFTADLREHIHTFEPQAMITQDNVTVYLNAVPIIGSPIQPKLFMASPLFAKRSNN